VQTIDKSYVATTEVNRSKFIAHLVPIDEFGKLQAKLKKEHPKANHIVYAQRYLNEYEQIVENSSDDGEPKGCAGVPSLNVLRGKELINVAVLIVRYFGGIKLGTGGMARAYASSVKNVLEVASLKDYEKLIDYSFQTSYSDIDKTMYKLKELGITQIDREFDTNYVNWTIKATQQLLDKMIIEQ
jgi:uncharacterized YigZ family protein